MLSRTPRSPRKTLPAKKLRLPHIPAAMPQPGKCSGGAAGGRLDVRQLRCRLSARLGLLLSYSRGRR
jgi:hypothetical protein